MALKDIVSSVGDSIVNLIARTLQGVIDYVDNTIPDVGVETYLERVIASDGTLQFQEGHTLTFPSSVTGIGDYALQHAFYGYTGLTTIDLSSVQTVGTFGLSSTFVLCSDLTSINLSNLQSVANSGLSNAFQSCTNLVSVDLSNLQTIGQAGLMGAFMSCTNLTELSFPSLTSESFGNYTNQFNMMLFGVTGCTVHFPSNLEDVISSWSDVTDGFSGTDTTVLFDLEATE